MHCVRCHATYRSTDLRKATACVIPHVFDSEFAHIAWSRPGYAKDYAFDSVCCGPKKTVIEVGAGGGDYKMKKAGKCFRGAHTTVPTEVKYNGVNVVRCVAREDSACRKCCLEEDYEPHHAPISRGRSSPTSKKTSGQAYAGGSTRLLAVYSDVSCFDCWNNSA